MSGLTATTGTERLERVLQQHALIRSCGGGFAQAMPTFAELCAAYDLPLGGGQPDRRAEPGRSQSEQLPLRRSA
ncbi:MAG TPA: hypothetical protein VKV26_03390 [Dehalococcoidia bacterium]|nr:hypothetical protein [Dehalococcoidia bacterium]